MKRCENCGATILFGPVRQNGHIFCNNACREKGVQKVASAAFPQEFVMEQVRKVHEGSCPKCGGEGPVDVHTSHRVTSFLVATTYKSVPQVCCASCGKRARWQAIGANLLFGWWGFPWGLVLTPAYILRNLGGARSSAAGQPSDQLVQVVHSGLGRQFMASSQEQPAKMEQA